MLYDLTQEIDRERLRVKVEHLCTKGCVVDLTEKRQGRTLNQNAYHAVCISYVAAELGESYQYVNEQYYKKVCNYDLFVRRFEDPVVGPVLRLRSSRDLSKDEMTLSIERFRNWAAKELGMYIPDPSDRYLAQQFVVEAGRTDRRYV